jgi:YesN/AraC family two-component response regulator
MPTNLVLLKPPLPVRSETLTLSDDHCNTVFASVENNDVVIAFIKSGTAELCAGDGIFTAASRDMLVFNSDETFILSAKDASAVEIQCLYCADVHYNGYEQGVIPYAIEHPVVNILSNGSLIISIFDTIIQEIEQKQEGYRQIASKLCETFLMYIHRSATIDNEEGSGNSIITQAKEYIDANYSRNITLNDLSSIVFISPYHLGHLFKKEVGISPIQYLINCRIEKAKAMLVETDASISDISNAVGYPNANYFNLIFKRFTGRSPGRYRKENT